MLGDSAAERAFYFFGSLIVRLAYRVNVIGHDNLPRGGCLLVPNHITWVDAVVLQLGCPRPIRFIIDEEFYRNRILHPILRMVRAIPINRARPREAIRRAAAQIQAGQIVCIFPEGQLSRTGTLQRLQRGFEIIARHAQSPVVPAFLDQLWGSIFSFRGGRFFRKWPKAATDQDLLANVLCARLPFRFRCRVRKRARCIHGLNFCGAHVLGRQFGSAVAKGQAGQKGQTRNSE